MANSVYDDFPLSVLLGLVPGYYRDTKFGRNAGFGTTQETLWSKGGAYVYLDQGVSDTIGVISDNVADAGLTITVRGMDTNYIEFEEEITLDAVDPVNVPAISARKYHRGYRSEVIGPRINAGNISGISNAAGNPTLIYIDAGEGQTQMLLFTVPADKTCILLQAAATVEATKVVLFRAKTRAPGRPFITKRPYDGSAGSITSFFVASRIPEKYDYEVTAESNLSTAGASVNVDYLFIDNDKLIGK